MNRILCCLLFSIAALRANAQQDVRFFKQRVAALCGLTMNGRGYVAKGADRAASYIQRQFAGMGLQPVSGNYYQEYTFGVNTFPDTVEAKVNKKTLRPGEDFLIDAASPSYHGKKRKVKTVNLDGIDDAATWEKKKAEFAKGGAVFLLRNIDSLFAHVKLSKWRMASELPEGCYILPQKGKMIWTVSAAPPAKPAVLYIEDSVLPKKVRRLTLDIHSKYIADYKAKNVMAMVPGTGKADSFIVFTAHYDHLGKMGHNATFPGASDNASGTAMILWLAQYYAAHPQRYSMVFIAFSGEEAGLLGSQYFAAHPALPLDKIRFLINTDIMGDATDGISVVNATEHKEEFSILEGINKDKKLLPLVFAGGKAANSDHHSFSERGVPAFFIFSRGGKGYYHDVLDKPASLSFANVPKVAELITEFVGKLQ